MASRGGDARRKPGPKGPWKWTEPRIRRELIAFMRERRSKRWPTSSEFRAAGRADLMSAITAYGGVVYWAEKVGAELGPGQNREPYLMTEALAEAREVIEQLGYLPGLDTLRELGHFRLVTVVRAHGGAAKFCAEFGLTRPSPR